MIENILQGFSSLLAIENFLMMNIGLFVGIVIGALPGLTATMGVALIMPMTFGMPTIPGILLLLGVYCGGIYGGSISAIVLNTPGTPAAAATTWDGYALAKQGKAGQALDMALIASTVGGIFSALMLLCFAPIIANYALKFGATEMFSLCFFGLTVIASLCGKNLLKGLSMALLGMFLASVGLDPIEGVARFTFGSTNLSGGFDLTTALIGLFAVSEILNKIRNIDLQTALITKDVKGTVPAKTFFKNLPTMLLGGGIGTIIGAIPGTGSVIAAFLSYNEARRASKHPEEFGKGSLTGIAAAESGNNGVTGATLIPLLTLGVPGDTVTAILLGAFMVQGLTPGPMLFATHGDTLYTIIVGLIVCNLFMLLQGKALIRAFAKITLIPSGILLPILSILVLAGAYATKNSWFDVRIMLLFGLVGYIALKFDYPITPMVLAFVLGPMTERYLRRALVLSEGSLLPFVTRPISLFFIVLALASVVIALIKNRRDQRKEKSADA